MNTTIRKANGATQAKEVVDQEIREFNVQASGLIHVLPTLYHNLWHKITMATRTIATGKTQAGWKIRREISIRESPQKICSTPTCRQATTPTPCARYPIRPLNFGGKKTVAMLLIQALALALKLPL